MKKTIIFLMLLLMMSTSVFSWQKISDKRVTSEGNDVHCADGDIYTQQTKAVKVMDCDEWTEWCNDNNLIYPDLPPNTMECRKFTTTAECGSNILHFPYVSKGMTDFLTSCTSTSQCQSKYQLYPFANQVQCKYGHCCTGEACDSTICYYNVMELEPSTGIGWTYIVGPVGVRREYGYFSWYPECDNSGGGIGSSGGGSGSGTGGSGGTGGSSGGTTTTTGKSLMEYTLSIGGYTFPLIYLIIGLIAFIVIAKKK